jgi:predicted transcriptional regulator
VVRDDLDMDLERRQAVLKLIQEYPGLHLSEIARRLQWSPMLTEYHLRMLEKHDLVSSMEEDHYRRYYAKVEQHGLRVDVLGTAEKRLLALLRHPVRLHIITFLAAHGEGRNRDMAESLGLSRPATSYQLARLLRAEVVTKDEGDRYRLVDKETILRLLRDYKPPADLVERFRTLWDRLYQAG